VGLIEPNEIRIIDIIDIIGGDRESGR